MNKQDLMSTLRQVRETLADFPLGVTLDDLYDATAKFLAMSGGMRMLRFLIFSLEMDDFVVKEDRSGTAYFKLTPDGFLKEALHKQQQGGQVEPA